ncbi:MAG TPA: hypothetical protein PLC68_09005 [Caldisericia bacterium]|nr:hypothetical protein [Caldisericia bacterium]
MAKKVIKYKQGCWVGESLDKLEHVEFDSVVEMTHEPDNEDYYHVKIASDRGIVEFDITDADLAMINRAADHFNCCHLVVCESN